MKNITKAQAARRVKEALSGLQLALKDATPAERKVLGACMCELKEIKSDLDGLDLDNPDALRLENDEQDAVESGDLEDLEELGDDEAGLDDFGAEDAGLDGLDDGLNLGDEDMDDEDLAPSALE